MSTIDFFIIGAPKSGTTALASYLARHPDVYMSTPKEPNYFVDDVPGYNRMDKDEYFNLFKNRKEKCKGEASTIYLYSDKAVPNILEYNPNARFIVLIRDPVKMFASWHNQLMKHFIEEEANPKKAWDLQEQRKLGERIPALCKIPDLLQYRDTCAIGHQIKRATARIPQDNLLVLRQDELQNDTRGVYLKVLNFLGVPDDGQDSFKRENQSAKPRSSLVQKLVQRPYPWLRPLGRILRKMEIDPRSILFRMNLKKTKVSLDPDFEKELRTLFEEEIEMLEETLQQDFSDWRTI